MLLRPQLCANTAGLSYSNSFASHYKALETSPVCIALTQNVIFVNHRSLFCTHSKFTTVIISLFRYACSWLFNFHDWNIIFLTDVYTSLYLTMLFDDFKKNPSKMMVTWIRMSRLKKNYKNQNFYVIYINLVNGPERVKDNKMYISRCRLGMQLHQTKFEWQAFHISIIKWRQFCVINIRSRTTDAK